MALSYNNKIDGQTRVYKLDGGLKIVETDVTMSDVSADYSSGITLTLSQFGLQYVIALLDGSVRDSSNAQRALEVTRDANTGKIRFYGGATEAVADSTLVDADIARLVLLGI